MTWDRVASTYDKVAAKYAAQFLDELNGKTRDRELLSAFADSVGGPVADVGCGPGQIGCFARDRGRRVIGVDLSWEMASLARERLDASLVADLRSLPFGSGHLGGVLAFYSLIHLQRPELLEVFAEFKRVLRPGGRALVSAHEGRGEIERDIFLGEEVPFVATLFELGELVEAADHAGLEVVGAERRAPYSSESGTVCLYVEAVRPTES